MWLQGFKGLKSLRVLKVVDIFRGQGLVNGASECVLPLLSHQPKLRFLSGSFNSPGIVFFFSFFGGCQNEKLCV